MAKGQVEKIDPYKHIPEFPQVVRLEVPCLVVWLTPMITPAVAAWERPKVAFCMVDLWRHVQPNLWEKSFLIQLLTQPQPLTRQHCSNSMLQCPETRIPWKESD